MAISYSEYSDSSKIVNLSHLVICLFCDKEKKLTYIVLSLSDSVCVRCSVIN